MQYNVKDKTFYFSNTKICYSQKRFVFLHRNQNLILFINEVNYFLRELGKRFHEDI